MATTPWQDPFIMARYLLVTTPFDDDDDDVAQDIFFFVRLSVPASYENAASKLSGPGRSLGPLDLLVQSSRGDDGV